MHYNINIEFTSNDQKAGKLSFVSDDGNVILSKVPVAMPYKPGVLIEKTLLKTHTISPIVPNATSDYINQLYLKDIAEIKKERLIETIRNAQGEPVIAGEILGSGKNLTGDYSMFILKDEDFQQISKILSNRKNNATLRAERVSFLWFPENVNAHTIKKITLLNDLKGHEENLKIYSKPKETNLVDQGRAKLSSKISEKSVEKSVEKSSVKAPVSKINKNSDSSKINASVNNVTSNRVTQDTSNNVDAFDIYFMYSNPDLALFYKPNSMFAWMAYFGRDTSNLDRQHVMNNINNVPGFENVASSDFKYTAKGYSVTMYEDENKEVPTGTLIYENDSVKVVSPTGEMSVMEQDDRGVWIGSTQNSQGNALSYSFVPTEEGYVGNWTSTPSDGVEIKSGVSFDSSFQMSSTPNEPVNIDRYVNETNNDWSSNNNAEYSMSSALVLDTDSYKYKMNDPEPSLNYDTTPTPSYTYTPEPEKTYEQDWRETPPPPPPPPPPDETSSWAASTDSYSKFGM